LFLDLSFENEKWILTNQELATKLANFSLFMTETYWGSAENFMASRWLANAILKGFETGMISWDEFHFGTDQLIWDRLVNAKELFIQSQLQMIRYPDQYYHLVEKEQADMFIQFKCRGIDPWIKQKGQVVRLISVNPTLKQALQNTKQRSTSGWPIEILPFKQTSSSRGSEDASLVTNSRSCQALSPPDL